MQDSNVVSEVSHIQRMSLTSEISTGDQDVDQELKELYAIRDHHSFWENPLLLACQEGQLSRDDFRFLFAQYYFYAKNFTKLLAGSMLYCDNDYYRSQLSANLWEEGGGQEIEKRHAELFRQFLKQDLNLDLEGIQFQSYTKHFFKQYMDLCSNANPIISAAALSFGTEGIVSRLYAVLIKGLKKAGFQDAALDFFHLHVSCDDDHAETLEEMTLSYRHEKIWKSSCEQGIIQALDFRNTFFNDIYNSLQVYKLSALAQRASHAPSIVKDINITKDELILQSTIYQTDDPVYYNEDKAKKINFAVQRVPFEADILDPRLVSIPQGHCNELHQHAHETVFLILEGTGEVIVDGQKTEIKPGDLIFVPRWKIHQTRNTGTTELKFFAVTDYGFTKIFPQNSETVYRQKPQNVGVHFNKCAVWG